MTTAGAEPGHIDIGKVLRDGLDIYKRSAVTIWVVTLILVIPVAILRYFEQDTKSWILGLIASVAALILELYLTGALVKVVKEAEEEGSAPVSTAGSLIGSVTPKLIPLLIMGIIVAICTSVGFVLLIIPGIFVLLVWSVCVPAMMVEDRGIFDSLGRSYNITNGNRWRMIGLAIVLAIIYLVIFFIAVLLAAIAPIIGVIAFVVVGVLLYPYSALIRTVLFYDLLEANGEAAVVVVESVTETSSGEMPA
jgi:hypothetical protein